MQKLPLNTPFKTQELELLIFYEDRAKSDIGASRRFPAKLVYVVGSSSDRYSWSRRPSQLMLAYWQRLVGTLKHQPLFFTTTFLLNVVHVCFLPTYQKEVHSLASFPGPKQVNKAIHLYTPA